MFPLFIYVEGEGEQYTSMQGDAAPVTVQGGSLFRSEEMALCQLFLQSEVTTFTSRTEKGEGDGIAKGIGNG